MIEIEKLIAYLQQFDTNYMVTLHAEATPKNTLTLDVEGVIRSGKAEMICEEYNP